jgi:hypothetical protein
MPRVSHISRVLDKLRNKLTTPEAAHFIRFDIQALDHHVLCAGDRLDMEMIRQDLKALDQKP